MLRSAPALLAAAATLAALPAAADAKAPFVDCRQRAEPSGPAPERATHIVAGPVSWGRPSHGVTSKRGGAVTLKLGLNVETGPVVTVRMLTPGAALIYRQETRLAERVQDADRVVQFQPCPPDTPRFRGDETVGPRTGFAGALIADRRKCVRVRVTTGGRSWTARIPIGRRCR